MLESYLMLQSGYFDPIAKYFVTGNIKAPYVDAAYKDSRGIFAISMNGQVVDFATAYPEARIEQASLNSKTLASAGTKVASGVLYYIEVWAVCLISCVNGRFVGYTCV